MSKTNEQGAVESSAGAIAGNRAKAIEEAKRLLSHYEPESGRGASLAEPSQGEARRMLAALRALLLHVDQRPALQQPQVHLETR